jgi:hypothetical protein
MRIIILFLGTLFLNSCFHEFQKLNCYNHNFLYYLQVLELDLKFVTVWKIKFKYLKIGEMFLQAFGFFSCTSILMWRTFQIFFLANGMCFHNWNHPWPFKNENNIGDTFGVFLQVQMIWYKLLWGFKGRLEMFMKKTKSFFCFEMLKEG